MTENSKHIDGHAYFIRKPFSYLELMQDTLSNHHNFLLQPNAYRIVDTIELSGADYKEFINNGLLRDQDFLKKYTNKCLVNAYSIWQTLKVVNKDNPTETILVQTERYDYARYIAIESYYPDQLQQKVFEMTKYTNYFIPKGNHWYEGRIDSFIVHGKVYPKPSIHGIDNGRISKMTILDSDNNTLVNYDRGWDIKPSEEHMELFNKAKVTLENIKPKQKNRNQER